MSRVARAEPGRGERGSAAVEFALVLPLVLVMALALVQVGLVARDRLVLEAASRAGAREAAVTPEDSEVAAAVAAAATGLDPAALSVAVTRTGGRGQPVTVTVGYSLPIAVPFVGWLFGDGVDLNAEATARQEFST